MLMFHWSSSVTLEDVQAKGVICENCQCEYYYVMRRTATAETRGLLPMGLSDMAAARARSKLKQSMRDCEPSPCPDCGWYQPPMVRKLALRRYKWLLLATAAAVVWAVFVQWLNPQESNMIAMLVAAALLGVALILMIFFLPNASAHQRAGKRSPDQPIFTREEVEELIQTTDLENSLGRSIFRAGYERFTQNPPAAPTPAKFCGHSGGFVPMELQQSKRASNRLWLTLALGIFAVVIGYAFLHRVELYWKLFK